MAALPLPSHRLVGDETLVRLARLWCLVVAPLTLLYLCRQFTLGWTDGAGHPFGEDFLNFWAGARLAQQGQWPTIYNLAAFHGFEEALVGAPLDLYHYSYPPVAWILTAPFGALPYLAAWALWQVCGWLAFALAVRRLAPGHWVLIALAAPAVFINSLGGQNGCWTAAAVGWGMILLHRRPALAGAILALFTIKPQLGWLIPVALLAGRHFRALGVFAGTALALILASLALFGAEAWAAYAAQGAMLKAVILEQGSGTWHRMLSLFVLVRHAGAPIGVAYGVQLVASVVVTLVVAKAWHKGRGDERSAAMLVLGMLAGSLYVSDYDCVMLVLAACWLWPGATAWGRGWLALAIVAPLLTASLATASGLALCAILLWPPLLWAFWSTSNKDERGSSGRQRFRHLGHL